MYNRSCLLQNIGLWAIDTDYANQLLAFLASPMVSEFRAEPVQAQSGRGYDLIGDTAFVPLVGHLSRGGDSFGGGSTVFALKGLRAARNDGHKKIGMFIDSPGGLVEGTDELATGFKAIGDHADTIAHIRGMGTSAAYWVASQAHKITANRDALVGNIGVRGQILDSSKAAEIQGLKVHLLTTGPFKAIGMPGVEVTQEQIEHSQQLVDKIFAIFTQAVESGRNLEGSRLEEVLDGRAHMAADALALGLVDDIGNFEDLYQGDTGMNAEEIAAVTASVIKSLSDQGIFATSDSATEPKPEPKPEPVAEPFATAYAPPLALPGPEPVTTQASSLEDSYLSGFEKGKEQVKANAIGMMQSCIRISDTMQDKAELIQAIQGVMTALGEDKTLADYIESSYASRIDLEGDPVSNTPPLRNVTQDKQPKASRLTDEELYDRRNKRSTA